MNCQRFSLWLLTLPLLLLAGCQGGDDITHYQVPRPRARESERLMGAILPQQDGESWFFKFVGPASVVTEHQNAFSAFIQTVRLEDKADAVPTWKLPEGWKEEKAQGLRFATLHFGPEQSLELTVGRAGGNVLANVNRWLGQTGLGSAATENELHDQKVLKEATINDRKVYLVDITGPGGSRGKRGMTAKAPAGPPPARGEQAGGPKFDVPAGWKQVSPSSSIIRLAFRLPDSQEKNPEVTISSLAGDGGGLLANYQRWQDQVGLKKAPELPGDLKTIKVGGEPATYIDLLGPDGNDQQRMLVVVCKQGGSIWFFKMQARAQVIARQQAAFEAFVKSVRF